MSDRFYFVGNWSPEVLLAGEEGHHLSRVMRKTVGQEIELFNGLGEFTRGELLEVRKDRAVIRIGEIQTAPPLPSLTLAVSPPKGDRLKWLVEKATELGVTQLIPLQTERSVVIPRETKLSKLQQTIVSACKQSGRYHGMDVSPVTPLSDLLANSTGEFEFVIGAVPGDGEQVSIEHYRRLRHPCLCVGPEGGFSDSELEMLGKVGALPIQIGPCVLRTETAAIALSSFFQALRLSGN